MKRGMAALGWCAAGIAAAFAQERRYHLNDGWSFRQVGTVQWRSAEVPGVVHTDLLRHGAIPDFMLGSNSDSVRWVELEDWEYRRPLFVDDALLRHEHLELVFKGLDTFAEVRLNDSLIGTADNMFRTWAWRIKPLLRKGENDLRVIFRSPIKEGAKLRQAYGIRLPHDSDPSGVSPYVRKAAYQFGWDFCPRLVTSGIWKEVELRGWSGARIADAEVRWSAGAPSAFVLIEGDRASGRGLRCELWLDGKRIGRASPLGDGTGFIKSLDGAGIPEWRPVGMGEPVVRRLEARLIEGGRTISSIRLPLARTDHRIRTRADAQGVEFTPVAHGRPFFAKGCNLVPPDLVPT
ncbi:MAG: glycosyl hydrolase 2 galactose-binding domain-containing protein, partial [Flavobacteriales bacterium]